MKKRYLAPLAAAAFLSACGVTPIEQDQPVYLAQGQGLAAVMFDTLDPLSQIVIEPSTPGGSKLSVPTVPSGKHIYLFPVNAGQYCFTRFQYGRWNFHGLPGQLACFEVKAGELGYSGTLAPRVENGEVFTHQEVQMDDFRTLLMQDYPTVAKQFLPPPPKPYTDADLRAPAPADATAQPVIPADITPREAPPAGTDQISSWIETVPNTRADVVFFRNNTGWTMEVRRFELYECIGVKQACGVQKFTLTLPPHATKAAMVVEPAAPMDAYSFRTRYIYGFVANPEPAPAPKKKKH